MVAALHPLAVDAGLLTLERGGNAIDAAVTMGFAMAVVEPHGSGIGGGGVMVIFLAKSRRTVVIDFVPVAPLGAMPDTFELEDGVGPSRFGWRKVKNDANIVGYRAAAVPGLVAGLSMALERFGTVGLTEALGPAISLAADGVPVNPLNALKISAAMPILTRFPATASVFLPHGVPLRPGSPYEPPDLLVQTDLAATLRLVAHQGPGAFYGGPFAEKIADAMRNHDGLITEEDMARYRPIVLDAGQVTTYRDHQIVGVPGAFGCVTAQQGLNILEAFELGKNAPDSVTNVHLHVEAYKRAFADRRRFVADSNHTEVPWEGLLSRQYARALAEDIDPRRATSRVEPGDAWSYDRSASVHRRAEAPGSGRSSAATSTTHICAVDREGNAVSLTQTLVNGFGSAVIVPETGVLLNNAMLWFDPEPGRPNSVGPDKRGMNNMTPLIVLRDGRPLIALGAPGGARIPNALSQIISYVVDHGMGIQDAVAAPRIDCSEDIVIVDSRFPDSVPSGLAAIGHDVRIVEDTHHVANFSTPLAIYIDQDTGRLRGGVDVFSLATAAGF